MRARVLLYSLMLLCFVPATASAAVTITTVVDTSTTPLAGAPGSSAVIRNGHVAFMAHSPPGALYTWFSGTLGVAVDTTTAVPGGPGNFQSGDFLHQATVDGNGATALTIEPHTTTPAGVYDTASGSLQVTDQQFAQYPVGGWWEGARIDDGKVAFIARTASGVTGIHTNIGGAMQTIVDTNTLIPGTSLFFTGFRPPEISGQHVAFVGYSSSFQGVFLWDPVAGLTAVATTNTLLTECPTAGDTFIGFGTGVDADDGAVVFYGQGCRPTERIQGVFTNARGTLETVVLNGTPTPGGSGALLLNMQEAALDDGRVVFCGTDSGNPSPHSSSIFLWENGVLSRAFGEGDTFDGATLTTIGGNGNCLTQSLGWNGLSGDQLVFYGAFDDGKVGFFIANLNSTLAVPVSPAVRWLLAPLMIALAVLRLRRRQPSSRLA